MRRIALALLTVALLGFPTVDAVVQISLVSGTPQEGEYTMQVSVSGFTLRPPTSGLANAPNEGHILFHLNGEPCTDADFCAGDPATNLQSFRYKDLQPGDALIAELRQNDGTSLSPRQLVETRVPGDSPTGPRLELAGAPPTKGDYTLRVRVENFNLVDPDTRTTNVAREGHLQYYLNGVLCRTTLGGDDAGKCSADGATTDTSYDFEGLDLNDEIVVRLVRNDGTNLSPAKSLSFDTVSEAIAITSTQAREGDYVMEVAVGGLTLVEPSPPGQPPKPNGLGEGYLVYLLNGLPCLQSNHCDGPPHTISLEYTYRDLSPGDRIGVRVLENNGTAKDGPGIYLTLEAAMAVLPTLTPEMSILTAAPNPGQDYRMRIQMRNGDLVAPQTSDLDIGPEGHFVYFLNGAACTNPTKCAGNPATVATEYRFKGLVVGDVVGVEFVKNSGASYSPALRTFVATTTPAVRFVGDLAKAGDVNITVAVTGFRLLPPSGEANNAGEGHLHWLLNGSPCEDATHCGAPYATDSTVFPFKGLTSDDVVTVELVNHDHSSLNPPVKQELEILPAPLRANPLPGLELVWGVAVLAAAAVLLARRQA